MKVILPKSLVDFSDSDLPLFFLAGPIRGGGDWQSIAFTALTLKVKDGYVAIPSRYHVDDPIRKFEIIGPDGTFERQTDWERHYLEIASRSEGGCIIFWLPSESKRNPRDDGHPYARDTYGELGEWRGRMMRDPSLKVVIGADPDFPGLSQIKRNFDKALGRNFPVPNTLIKTIKLAIKVGMRS